MRIEDIKIGGLYIATKPANTSEAPTWTSGMDQYDGVTQECYEKISGTVSLRVNERKGGWAYHPNWLRPAGTRATCNIICTCPPGMLFLMAPCTCGAADAEREQRGETKPKNYSPWYNKYLDGHAREED
jgi:hypothetical protein